MRLMTFFSVFLAVAVFAVGCASTSRYATGLPRQAAPKFFFHMEQAALDRGLPATRGTDDQSLRISTDVGYLNYYVQEDEILLAITVHNPDDRNQNFIRQQETELKRLDEELQAEARARAEDANVFEP